MPAIYLLLYEVCVLYCLYVAGDRQKALSGEAVDEDDEADRDATTTNPFRPIAVSGCKCIRSVWCERGEE